MGRIDPEQERRRLREFYAGQMDGELVRVASQAYELTDLAREALLAELAKRDLKVPPQDGEVEVELELRELVTIRTFRDLPEALLAKGSLESAGIEAILIDDNVVRLDWFWSNLMGGIKLQVNLEDVDAANGILDQPIPVGFSVAGVGEYEQPRCPSCQSLDVTFQELDQPVAYVTAYLNLPIPWKRRAWRCHACNAEWEETEDRNEDRNEDMGAGKPE